MTRLTGRIIWASRIVFFLAFAYVTYMSVRTEIDDENGGMALVRFLSEFLFNSLAYVDKIAHFIAYGVLGFFAMAGLFLPRMDRIKYAITVCAALTTYGLTIEQAQRLGGVRTADWVDGFSNILGSFAGVLACVVFLFLPGILPRRP